MVGVMVEIDDAMWSPWQSGRQGPEIVGAYQREWIVKPLWSWWNGRAWGSLADSPARARVLWVDHFELSLHQTGLRWRGLTREGYLEMCRQMGIKPMARGL